MFVAANILPAYKLDYPQPGFWLQNDLFITITLICTAIFCGFGNAILWCAEGDYLTNCASPSTKGFYFGLFWFIFMANLVAGNLIGAFVLASGFS